MYLVKSPLLLKWFYPSLIWNKPRKEKIVYLTFDDGPIPNVTTFVLNTLKSYGAKATFFCIGENIHKHPSIFEQLKAEHHAIGNHTYNHLKGWKTDDEAYVNNFLKCQKLTQTNLFRPPYGRIKKSQVRKLE
jgi:peptidoglycan/xylan/chitin deacetylase (PgdA/CDA1 family)